MVQIDIKYNPYLLQTKIAVNGTEINEQSNLYQAVKGRRLQEWISGFPELLIKEYSVSDLMVKFYGMDLDWDDFKEIFQRAQEEHMIQGLSLDYVPSKSDDAIRNQIIKIFQELREGPIDDFRDKKLMNAFDNVNNAVFPINVIATMSSGKSTLINALLQKKLMPAKNEACTAIITKILDEDDAEFSAAVYNEEGDILRNIDNLTYDDMTNLNDNEHVSYIFAKGNIPFLDSKNMALMLVDTPGPNSALKLEHKNVAYHAINNDSNSLILYVLNAAQLGTTDDASLLNYVSEQMKRGGRQVRDRFLFVLNKMDVFSPEEDIEKAVLSAKTYLSGYGIEDPQIFPCSAYTALYLRTVFKDIDIETLTRKQEKELSLDARQAIPMGEKFLECQSLHLEKYSSLPLSMQRTLEKQLALAQEREDVNGQILVHCGILSIEQAITAYVKKYAKTKKIKDLVETFQEVLESSQVLIKAKTKIATDEIAARECVQRAENISAKIADGKEAQIFKEKIAEMNPIYVILEKAEKLKKKAARNTEKAFDYYGGTINNREEAKRLVKQFTDFSSSALAELASELESMINKEVVDAGNQILLDYQKKLTAIDEMNADHHLDFRTVDLVKGALVNMKETARSWCSDDFVDDTIEDMGIINFEEKTYYEKIGEKEGKILKESRWEKVGTKKIQTGTHKEKNGTKNVMNPKKQGTFGRFKFWQPDYIQEDVLKEIIDYVEEDVFQEVKIYETIVKDIFEQRTELIEKYSVNTATIQDRLVSKFWENLNNGVDDALDYADKQISYMQEQFTGMFQDLDNLITSKYEELKKCAIDRKKKEEDLKKNKEIIRWIEKCKKEIEDALKM